MLCKEYSRCEQVGLGGRAILAMPKQKAAEHSQATAG